MIHGPCGTLNPNSPCMVNGKCSKNYPYAFNNTTRVDRGKPIYQRREDGHIYFKTINGVPVPIDNRFVVPYNPYLLKKYNCHINVEIVGSRTAVKYLYKYICKGSDRCTLKLTAAGTSVLEYDEITSYLNGRYVGSCEAFHRLFKFPIHTQSIPVEKLSCHLPFQQNVVFADGNEAQAAATANETKLQRFFELNSRDPDARQYTYDQIPQHYVWKNKRWEKRQRGQCVTRLYTVSPRDSELYHLRLLLTHVKGPTSSESLRTVNGQLLPTFKAAAQAHGIAINDDHWKLTLDEAKETRMPAQIRTLFANILTHCNPTSPSDLWEEFKRDMYEDYARTMTEEEAENRALFDIETVLATEKLSCAAFGLPSPVHLPVGAAHVDLALAQACFDNALRNANPEQLSALEFICNQVASNEPKLIMLDAPAGCGKTFVTKAVIARMQIDGIFYKVTAYTGIAASLYDDGRTLHSVFGLPVPCKDTSVSSISANSPQAQNIANTKVLIIDEIGCAPKDVFDCVDRFCRDIASEELRSIPFGGKIVIMSGDFRQCLPVVPRNGRAGQVENCVKLHRYWPQVHTIKLTTNMRLSSPADSWFAQYLLNIGNDAEEKIRDSLVKIPDQIVGVGNVIDYIYPNINFDITQPNIINRAILTCKNDDCLKINQQIQDRMTGDAHILYSFDSVIDCPNPAEYPTEFLNSLEIPNLPPHKLVLKKGSIALIIRNLNSAKGIINGTRVQVISISNYLLTCLVLTGISSGETILVPRIKLRPSELILPCEFERIQFPIKIAFAMTINKAQGQSLEKVGVYLPTPVFTHGLLYTALSRATNADNIKVFIDNTEEHGQVIGHEGIYTNNIVFNEIL